MCHRASANFISIVAPSTEYGSPSIQSMDSFTKMGTFGHPLKESDHHTARNMILRTYELFVRTKVYDNVWGQPSLHLVTGDKVESPSHPILARMDEFVRCTNEHGIKLLRDIPENLSRHLSVRMAFVRKPAMTDSNCRRKSN